MAKERLEVHGDAAGVLREYAKLINKNDDLKRKLREVREEAKQARQGFGSMGQGLADVKRIAVGVAGALGIGMGVQGAIQGIVKLVADWKQYMADIAQTSRDAGREMTALAMLQEKGKVRERVIAAANLGAQYGQSMGASWNTVQAFQSKTGTFQGGMNAARAAFNLAQSANVDLEGARQAVSVGMGLGLKPGEAARAAYAAGQASQLSPAELAQMAGQGLPAFGGVGGGAVTGYGVAAALSGLISDPGNLATYTRQVGTLMQQRTGEVGALWKKLGFKNPGQDVIGQLRALHDNGIRTMGDLQAAGFAKKESLGLSILLKDFDSSIATIEDTQRRYADVGAMERNRADAEAESPEMRFSRTMDQLQRATELARTFGPTGPRARQEELNQRVRALAYEKHGLGNWVEDGKADVSDEWKIYLTSPGKLWDAMKTMKQIHEQIESGEFTFDVDVTVTPNSRRNQRSLPNGE